MPTIPDYNLAATEEAGLTRAKRRVIKNMQSGLAKMTERPAVDLTKGDADVLGNRLIAQFEDLTALFRQITSFFGSGVGEVLLTESSDIVKAMTVVILSAKAVNRIVRTVKRLVPRMKYIDLGILSDLKSVQQECTEAAQEAFYVLDLVEFGADTDPEDLKEVQALTKDEDLLGFQTLTEDEEEELLLGLPPLPDAIQSAKEQGRRALEKRAADRVEQLQLEDEERLRVRDERRRDRDLRTLGESPIRRGRPVKAGSPADLRRRAEEKAKLTELAREASDMARESAQMGAEDEAGKRLLAETRADEAQLRAESKLADQVRAIPVIFKRLDYRTFQTLLQNMIKSFAQALRDLSDGYEQFNQFRQQRVVTIKSADVSNEIKTAAGYGYEPRRYL